MRWCTSARTGVVVTTAPTLLALHGVERVVWVTCTPWVPAVGAADDAIRSLPASDPRVVVADWALYSGAPGLTYDDGLHLTPAGAAALAELVSARGSRTGLNRRTSPVSLATRVTDRVHRGAQSLRGGPAAG